MSLASKFAGAVYHARTERGLTQAQAAEALDISTRWYQCIENDAVIPSGELTLKIIEFFNIPPAQLRENEYVQI